MWVVRILLFQLRFGAGGGMVFRKQKPDLAIGFLLFVKRVIAYQLWRLP